MIGSNNQLFVESATQLDEAMQMEIRDMVISVVKPDSQPDGIDPGFAQVLTQPSMLKFNYLWSLVMYFYISDKVSLELSVSFCYITRFK